MINQPNWSRQTHDLKVARSFPVCMILLLDEFTLLTFGTNHLHMIPQKKYNFEITITQQVYGMHPPKFHVIGHARYLVMN